MKKLYVLLLAMISVGSVFAQNRGDYHQENGYSRNDKKWEYNQPGYNNQDRNYPNHDPRYNQQQQMQERDRRAAIDRVNRDYDQRIMRYRNDRSMNRYERDRRIADAQRERQQKINSFGKGIIAGAIVGLIAGAIFSN